MTADAARVARILERLPEPDRIALLGALSRPVARAVRQADRDQAIRAVARWLPVAGGSTLAVALALSSELRRYGSTAWRTDQLLTKMPASYRGTPREHLFTAWHASGGRPPLGQSRLRQIVEAPDGLPI